MTIDGEGQFEKKKQNLNILDRFSYIKLVIKVKDVRKQNIGN